MNDEGHKHVTMVVGDDRVKEFDSLTKKYNGVHYDFNTINIKSAGARDPKSKDPIEKLSASAMRKHASGDDHDSFHAGMPKGISRKHSQQMMADVKTGMTPPPKKGKKKDVKEWFGESLWEFAPKLAFDGLRENYIAKNIFCLGDMVENLNHGLVGKIIRAGANYVIAVTEDNIMFKSWLKDLNEYTEVHMKSRMRDKIHPNTLVGTRNWQHSK